MIVNADKNSINLYARTVILIMDLKPLVMVLCIFNRR